MRKSFWILLLLTAPVLADYRPDRDGASTTIALKVVDSYGTPLEGAKVMFRMFTTFDKCYKLMRDTDGTGRCEVSGTTRGEVTVVADKDGYYTSYGKLKYRDLSWEEAVAERKWTRGIVENTIVMKKVGKPEKHRFGAIRAKVPPAINVPLAFDVDKFDWCAPHGNGQVEDFQITCCISTNALEGEVYGLVLEAKNCLDGFIRRDTDEWSCFRYDLVADTLGKYTKTIMLDWVPNSDGVPVKYLEADSKHYTVFRTRSVTNSIGRIVSSNYGIILDGVRFDGKLSLGVQLNPKDNDPGLEDDWAYRNMKKGR